jgi:hypothetical protein
MALGSTQPLTELSIRNFPAGKGRTTRKAENLTTPSVYQLSRKCGSLDVLQFCGIPWPLTGMALAFYLISYFHFVHYSKIYSCD